MGAHTRRTIVTVGAIAVVAFATAFRTLGPAAQLIIGALLFSAAVAYGSALEYSRRAGRGDAPARPKDVGVVAVAALVPALLTVYALSFDGLPSAWRVGLGVALAVFGAAVAWALWPGWKAVASSALALAVIAYGVLFEDFGSEAQVGIGVGLAVVLFLLSGLVSQSASVVVSLLLAYGIVVYRLAFGSIDDVGWRTLIGAGLIFVAIAVALKWWLYWQFPRARWAAAVIVSISLGLVVFTLVRGVELLGTKQPPREQAEAPAVGFVPPQTAEPGRGFAVGMGIRVTRCDEPVHVKLVVAGTAEYWRDRKGGRFKLGIPGRKGTDLTELRYGTGFLSVQNPMDAEPRVHARGNWSVRTVQNMTVISGGLRENEEVIAEFNATSFDRARKWLEERGQGSCYLRLPALAGNFTAFAAEQADGRAYPERAMPLDLRFDRSGECVLQVSERRHNGDRLAAHYCPEAELVHGSVAVRAGIDDGSAGAVITDESLPEPNTVVEGDPVWSCRSDPRGRDKARVRAELQEVRLGLPYSTDRLRREIARNCSGFVAFSEADADERRDVTLILIGIGIALGLGAFIELLMRWIEAEFPLKHRPDPPGTGVGRDESSTT